MPAPRVGGLKRLRADWQHAGTKGTDASMVFGNVLAAIRGFEFLALLALVDINFLPRATLTPSLPSACDRQRDFQLPLVCS